MKFRASQWLDTSNMDAEESPMVYGIQVNKGDGWRNVARNGEAVIFNSLPEVSAEIARLEQRFAA